MAVYARRAGHLPERLRVRAVETIRRELDPKHPLYRLSPHLLAKLGEPTEASARRRELQASAEPGSPYSQWLKKTAPA
jgi:hypothetical protein